MESKQLRFFCQTGDLKQIRAGLSELTPERKGEALRFVLQTPLWPEVIEYLGMEITRLPAAIGATLLIDLLYSEEASVRNLAIELFPAFGKEALEELSHHLNDANTDVRLFAVQSLSLIPNKDEVPPILRSRLFAEQDINIQAAIIEALGDLGSAAEDADAICALAEVIQHPYLKFVAARALSRLGASSAQIASLS
jgi:HEAT repeat protein